MPAGCVGPWWWWRSACAGNIVSYVGANCWCLAV